MAASPVSILVLRNNDLGDVVVITPLFQALRQAFPDSRIVAAVGSWSKDILGNNPYISEIVECNAPWHNHVTATKSVLGPLKYIFGSPEASRLRDRNFDVGIDVLGSTYGSMLLMRMGIPIRLGRKGYAGGHTGTTGYLIASRTVSVAAEATQFARLLKADAETDFGSRPQLFLDPAEIEEAEQAWLRVRGQSAHRGPRIVIAPGAGVPEKQWPVSMFAGLAGRLSSETCGLVLGSNADLALGERIAQASHGWVNRCGDVSIRQSMALISLADLVVCHSSFVMHLAAAFNKPCIIILTRALDPVSHKALWEVEGVHHQMIPKEGEQHVQVSDVEHLARLLIQSARK
jgi:heptosyltransferase-2